MAGFVGSERVALLDEMVVLFGKGSYFVGFGLGLLFEGANVIVEEGDLALKVWHFCLNNLKMIKWSQWRIYLLTKRTPDDSSVNW